MSTESIMGQMSRMPTIDENTMQGSKLAVQLATENEQIESQKAQLEKQKFDIEQSKLNGGLNFLKTYSNMSPEVQKKFKAHATEQINKWIPGSGGLIDIASSSPEMNAKIANAANILTQNPDVAKDMGFADPSAAAAQISAMASNPLTAMSDISNFHDELVKHVQERAKQKADLAKTKLIIEGRQGTAETNAEARKYAADRMGAFREEGAAARAAKNITDDKIITQRKQQLDNINRGLNLIDEIHAMGDETDPAKRLDTVQTIAELGQELAKAIQGPGGGTGSERDEAAYNNFNSTLAKYKNKISTSGVAVVDDPVLLEQLGNAFSRLKNAYQKNIRTRALEKQRTSKIAGVNQAQEEAITKLTGEAPPAQGSAPAPAPTGSAQPSQPAPAPQAQSRGGFDKDAFIAKWTKEGKSPAQIQELFKKYGVK